MRQIFWIDRFDVCILVAKQENISFMLYWSLGLVYDLMSSKDNLNHKVERWIESFKGK